LASQGSCGAPTASLTLTCDIGGLANGASATVQIAVHPTTAGSLLNTATVVSTSLDPNPDNNASAASTTVDPNAGTPGGPGGQGLAACTIMGTPLADVRSGRPGTMSSAAWTGTT
jgi:hypothetical protein